MLLTHVALRPRNWCRKIGAKALCLTHFGGVMSTRDHADIMSLMGGVQDGDLSFPEIMDKCVGCNIVVCVLRS